MTATVPDGFLLLAATLLEALPSRGTSVDAIILQLQTIFGPMLLSSLQLVDRREVVLIELPSKRQIYQVTSSTGKPYTIHLSLPLAVDSSGTKQSANDTANGHATAETGPQTPTKRDWRDTVPVKQADITGEKIAGDGEEERAASRRVFTLAREMERAYCPCTGFMYNSLAGEKNVLCKHLLAVIIANRTNRAIKAEVQLPAVVSLLDLGA